MENVSKMKKEIVQNWMSKDIVAISPDTNLLDAHKIMLEKQIRRLPVVKNKQLIGIVTRGDVREAEPSSATSLTVWELNYLLAKLEIKKIMTPDPVAISEEATIGQAAQTMLEQKISGLPVLNNKGELVGIITESDIFRMVVEKWDDV